MIRVGTAGWQVPRPSADRFPQAPSQLERYAACFNAVEINSSFYRPHRPQTYARWASAVPAEFRFAVKLRRTLTHERRLKGCGDLLEAFLEEIAPLGARLGPILVQLPPSLAYDLATAESFFDALRVRHAGPVACEPRHPSWFEASADNLLCSRRIARVAADPSCAPAAAGPGGWPDLLYVRLHGTPRMYFSPYSPAELERWARLVAQSPAAERWCVLDNTGLGAAAGDALDIQTRLGAWPPSPGSSPGRAAGRRPAL